MLDAQGQGPSPERDHVAVLLGWADELDRSAAIHKDERHGKMPEKLRRVAAELERLRTAIRTHRDQRGDDRCWLDDRELYAALGEDQPYPTLPDKSDFLESCARFWERRRDPAAAPCEWGMTLAQLEAEVARLRSEAENLRAQRDGCRAHVLDLAGVLCDRCRELDRLREEARRAYHPDGTWELLDTPEEVVRVRIETAREVERLRGLLARVGELVLEADGV